MELLLILASIALVAACGAFVAAEFAFVTVDRPTVERAAKTGDPRAEGVLASLRSLSTQLSAAQVGITLTNLLIGFLAEPALAGLLDGPLATLGLGETAASGVALALALFLATSFTMLFGELVPKNLAIARPLETARTVQGFQRAFTRATAFPIRFLNGTANALLRRLGIEPQEELASARSPEELASLVHRSGQEGTLDIATATLLERSLAFGERRARDVMTPRGQLHEVAADDPVLAVVEAARATGRSRFPVLRGGDFTGIVHVKQAIAVPHDRRHTVPVSDVMGSPLLVPSSLDLDALLQRLREGGFQMALVVDEFGNVDGVVTLEDLIEELVGEVHDEHDERDDTARRRPDGSWVLAGLMRPDEIARRTGVLLPEHGVYETLGGLVAMRLARIPTAGDSVTLDAIDGERTPQRVSLTVLDMDHLRVDRVLLAHTPTRRAETSDA
jgi:CBS domain containing-hemolysin-like protein